MVAARIIAAALLCAQVNLGAALRLQNDDKSTTIGADRFAGLSGNLVNAQRALSQLAGRAAGLPPYQPPVSDEELEQWAKLPVVEEESNLELFAATRGTEDDGKIQDVCAGFTITDRSGNTKVFNQLITSFCTEAAGSRTIAKWKENEQSNPWPPHHHGGMQYTTTEAGLRSIGVSAQKETLNGNGYDRTTDEFRPTDAVIPPSKSSAPGDNSWVPDVRDANYPFPAMRPGVIPMGNNYDYDASADGISTEVQYGITEYPAGVPVFNDAGNFTGRKLYWQVLWEWNGKNPINPGGRGEKPTQCKDYMDSTVSVWDYYISGPNSQCLDTKRGDCTKLMGSTMGALNELVNNKCGEPAQVTCIDAYRQSGEMERDMAKMMADLNAKCKIPCPGHMDLNGYVPLFIRDAEGDLVEMENISPALLTALGNPGHTTFASAGEIVASNIAADKGCGAKDTSTGKFVVGPCPKIDISGMNEVYKMKSKFPLASQTPDMMSVNWTMYEDPTNWQAAVSPIDVVITPCSEWVPTKTDAGPGRTSAEWVEWSAAGTLGCNPDSCHNFRFNPGEDRPKELKVGDLKGCCCHSCLLGCGSGMVQPGATGGPQGKAAMTPHDARISCKGGQLAVCLSDAQIAKQFRPYLNNGNPPVIPPDPDDGNPFGSGPPGGPPGSTYLQNLRCGATMQSGTPAGGSYVSATTGTLDTLGCQTKALQDPRTASVNMKKKYMDPVTMGEECARNGKSPEDCSQIPRAPWNTAFHQLIYAPWGDPLRSDHANDGDPTAEGYVEIYDGSSIVQTMIPCVDNITKTLQGRTLADSYNKCGYELNNGGPPAGSPGPRLPPNPRVCQSKAWYDCIDKAAGENLDPMVEGGAADGSGGKWTCDKYPEINGTSLDIPYMSYTNDQGQLVQSVWPNLPTYLNQMRYPQGPYVTTDEQNAHVFGKYAWAGYSPVIKDACSAALRKCLEYSFRGNKMAQTGVINQNNWMNVPAEQSGVGAKCRCYITYDARKNYMHARHMQKYGESFPRGEDACDAKDWVFRRTGDSFATCGACTPKGIPAKSAATPWGAEKASEQGTSICNAASETYASTGDASGAAGGGTWATQWIRDFFEKTLMPQIEQVLTAVFGKPTALQITAGMSRIVRATLAVIDTGVRSISQFQGGR